MGIPKFFRFMSERYPLISQVVQENKIPEFDALYLDMNGIIHNCSHPNDGDASFRITEEAIFVAVFNYIGHLFSVIKPKQLFFLAVDGVAPRAKMNQQRSRRFRTAQEMKAIVDKARAKGEDIPESEGFDSNCITPGTPFMAKLSEQLKYFLAKKVTEDSEWQGIEVVLSGHDVPGEGEHKIMEYIRLKKAQPGYDPNVRHCLYGLDADLIMLGLLSHDPHFCLLREEVQFGPRRGKAKSLEEQKFFLLHLSLFREYLDLEFTQLKLLDPPLPFEYNLERIIDDFILINIFIGNDFLPHLPGLHINEGALGRLFDIYKRILPVAGGYLNEFGTLNAKRLQLVLNELAVYEREQFEDEFADSSWLRSKQSAANQAAQKSKARKQFSLTKPQKALFEQVKTFVRDILADMSPNARLVLPALSTGADKRALLTLADELQLDVAFDEYDENNESIVVLAFNEDMLQLARDDRSEEDGDSRPEWHDAIERVLNKYEKAPLTKVESEVDWEKEHEKKVLEMTQQWKDEYYSGKMSFAKGDKAAVETLVYRYVEGLQWVLSYYYGGVASWSWFYDYHYAPKISDFKDISKYTFKFELGHPFHPFEQLMGVLPSLSSAHVPPAFRELMSDPTSPILDFYPTDFGLDMNGKKQDWEAVVKIPFIDEKRLLATMKLREGHLTAEERARNAFGESTKFTHDATLDVTLPSSLPGFFPDLHHCKAKIEAFHLPTLEGGLSFITGLLPGVLLGKDAIAGFPSMGTIPYTGNLGSHGVNVFQTDSRGETMVITVDNLFEDAKSEEVAAALVGQRTFVGYPYLQEGKVVAIADELFRYELETLPNGGHRVASFPHRPEQVGAWKKTADRLEYVYSKRYGCILGRVEVIVIVQPLKGLRRLDDGSTVKEYEDTEVEFALQATVQDVSSEDVRYLEKAALPLREEFPEGAKVFFLGHAAYGTPAQVVGYDGDRLAIQVAFYPSSFVEDRSFHQKLGEGTALQYHGSPVVTKRLRIHPLTLSKITSSAMLSNGDTRINIGLCLKFEAKGQKVLGYTRKNEYGWEYSEKAIALIKEYKELFPEVFEAFESRRGKDTTNVGEIFFEHTLDRVKDLKAWLKTKGVGALEQVPLYADQLEKESVVALENLADRLTAHHAAHPELIKRAAIKAIPRYALLKPEHVEHRLREQTFRLGDRVIKVSDTGSIQMSGKGTVVGLQTELVEIVLDVPYIGGTTLGDRCSPYRGAIVSKTAILNITNPQYMSQTGPSVAPPQQQQQPRAARGRGGRGGPLFTRGPLGGASILPAQGLPAAGFTPAPNRGRGKPGIQVLQNPNRRGGAAPQPLSHQQQMAAALGGGASNGHSRPPSNAWSNGHGATNGHGGANGHGAGIGNHPLAGGPTPTHRGGSTPIRGAIQTGNGVAIPPPAHLNLPSRGRGRGGARGRGGRGGAGRGGQPQGIAGQS